MRVSNPKERLAGLKRKVKIVASRPNGNAIDYCAAYNVESRVDLLVVDGYKIVSVDGKKPPKGSDGRCSFDSDGGGPYWKSEL